MNLEHYQLKVSDSDHTYEFISEGKKGRIKKLIQFQETEEDGCIILLLEIRHPGMSLMI